MARVQTLNLIIKKERFLMETMKKRVIKWYVIASVVMLSFLPSTVGATAPSTYVNNITDGIWDEILKVAPNIALVVVGLMVIMYLMTNEEHKKSKFKSAAAVAVVAYLILLVLKPLMGWFDGLL